MVNTKENELYHYGIKGMKWGQRRYQNPDGSLTPRGRKRYSMMAKEQHPDYESAHRRHDVPQLSDKDLRQRINRLKMEQEYKKLLQKNSPVHTGKKWASRIVIASAAAAMGPFVKKYADTGMRFVMDMYVNPAGAHAADAIANLAKRHF